MSYYNLTNLTNSANVFDMFKATNELGIGGLLSYLILLVIFLVLFAAMKNYDTKVVFLTASFITSIIAVGFFLLRLIGIQGIIIPIVLLLVSIFVKLFGEGE